MFFRLCFAIMVFTISFQCGCKRGVLTAKAPRFVGIDGVTYVSIAYIDANDLITQKMMKSELDSIGIKIGLSGSMNVLTVQVEESNAERASAMLRTNKKLKKSKISYP